MPCPPPAEACTTRCFPPQHNASLDFSWETLDPKRTRAGSLQQTLLHLLLTGDAVLRPGYRLQTLLLQFVLTVGAHAIIVRIDALQRRVDQIEDLAIRIGHAEQ